jgi:hypothetical protein
VEGQIEKIRDVVKTSAISSNPNLIKILIAINSVECKYILDEDLEKLTELTEKKINEYSEILEKTNCIDTHTEEIKGKSPHKIFHLKEEGKKILKNLGIE